MLFFYRGQKEPPFHLQINFGSIPNIRQDAMTDIWGRVMKEQGVVHQFIIIPCSSAGHAGALAAMHLRPRCPREEHEKIRQKIYLL